MVKTKLGKIFLIILAAVLLFGCFVLGNFYGRKKSASRFDFSGTFNFVNPTVTANLGKHFIINFQPLKQKYLDIQKKYNHKNYIYFLYLNNAAWVGVNEKELFTAASTVKVPLAMTVCEMAQENKLALSDRYGLEELDLNDSFGNLYKIGADNEFTIDELLKIMLEQSDNTAANAIYKIFSRIGISNPLDDVYNSMGWEFNEFGQQPNYEKINLKTLSNMFLSLYNSTYVGPEFSEKILKHLANTPFNDKIVAGVPSGIKVAHKIGIASNKETFSDCGIVYAPGRNYLLCLGSNGGDEKIADQFMAEISAATYDFVINN